jgi:DNA-binding MarR family transcriptional regulator
MSRKKENRYNPLLKAIIKHSNIVSSGLNEKVSLNDDIVITNQEWIITELIVEQREEYYSMIELSRMIGIPQSSFFRMVSHLQKVGLAEKYRVKGNKKNIVLRPTELALQFYKDRTTGLRGQIWDNFFKALDRFSDEDIEAFTEAFDQLNEDLPSAKYSQKIELIKID